MNRRDYKEFGVKTISHIYNRGNNKENIFFDKQDYKAFLFRLSLALGLTEKEVNAEKFLTMPYSRIRIDGNKKLFRLHAFCLMPNHFHLIIEQIGDQSPSVLISKICTSYAKYFNKKYDRVGHLFQDKFKSVNISSDEQLMWTSAYIHMNPVKDGLVNKPENYDWSSYNDYISKRNLPILKLELIKGLFGGNIKDEIDAQFKKYDIMSKTVFDN